MLAGRLMRGTAATERGAFAEHPQLVAVSKPSKPPVLYHKGELSDSSSGGLSVVVRTAIATVEQSVVGVVFNAIDDQLGGSSQLHVRWRISDLPHLASLLREARDAGRVVIVTADHGHLLDADRTVFRNHADGDRWRRVEGAAAEGEIRLAGGRVLAPNNASEVILAWSERLRYASKKNGYHGGASPQEVLVPLSVFAPVNTKIPHWIEAPPVEPSWWFEEALEEVAPAPLPTATPKRAPRGQLDMFTAGAAAAAKTSKWIEDLLKTDLWSGQVQLAGRAAPPAAPVRPILQSLQARGWKASYVTLAQAAQLPALRVRGLLSGLRRVLNVDGVAVLTLDEREGFAELNTQLLANQFHIDRP
jgi:hypothetical protein